MEHSQGTYYNVHKTLKGWAKSKVQSWTKTQKKAIQDEFTRIDREFHSQRCKERKLRIKYKVTKDFLS
jgi:hypothetical protein